MRAAPPSLPSEVRQEVMSLLEGGDLKAAASALLPHVERSIGSELDKDLEFALCAVLMSSALASTAP